MKGDSWDIRRSIRRHVALSLMAAALLVGGVGSWAASTELAGAVVAPGSLVVASSVKKVQHPTGGVVGQIRVHEGDVVRAGDILVRLDETVTRANLAAVENTLIELYARLARLEAERDDSDRVVAPRTLDELADRPRVAEVMNGETKLFKLRQTARTGQKAQLRARIGQIGEEIEGLAGQIAGKKQEIELINQELVGLRELWKKNLVPIQRVTALARDAARIQGELGQLVASVAQAKGRISETELQIIQIGQDLRSEVAKEMRETEGKVAELVEKRVAAQDQLERIDVRAPQDGIVHQLSVHTIGGVIGPGEQLMLIVPRSDLLVVEAKIAPKDIDQVKFGQIAMLRFTALNQRTTPEIQGSVTLVGADEIRDEKSGTAYFKIQIAPLKASLKKLKDTKLLPGMPADVYVKTSSRTVLSYLIKPVTDQTARAFRED